MGEELALGILAATEMDVIYIYTANTAKTQ